jgi:hypothetical protein
MKMSQENSLYSYLKQTNISFFYIIGEQEGRTASAGGGDQWEGEGGRKRM